MPAPHGAPPAVSSARPLSRRFASGRHRRRDTLACIDPLPSGFGTSGRPPIGRLRSPYSSADSDALLPPAAPAPAPHPFFAWPFAPATLPLDRVGRPASRSPSDPPAAKAPSAV